MKFISKILFAILLVAMINVQAFCQDTYKQKVRIYLDETGSMSAFKTAIGSIIQNFSKMNDKVPAEFWSEVQKEIGATSLDDLVVMIEPVYRKHFTEQDLDAVIAFYRTPVGKKMAEKTPVIMQESMQAGQQWGMQLGEKIAEKLKKAGY